jgi:hypothetical protein
MTPDNKPREFFLCDETDNSGWSVIPWSEKEEKRQYGSCNVIKVREVLPNEASEIANLKQRLAEAEAALDSIACFSKPGQSSIGYWLELPISECAEVLAKDTQIARAYFERKK